MKHNSVLSDLFNPAQERQLTGLLAELMATGFGSVEILIVDHKPRFFRYKRSIKASPAADQLDNQQDFIENTSGIPPEAIRMVPD